MKWRLVSSIVPTVRGTEEMASSWTSGDSDKISDFFFFSHCFGDQALELVAQVVELPFLEIFKWPLDLTLSDTV